MSNINALYQDLILDHGRSPRRFGALPAADLKKEGFNPLCGDILTVYVMLKDNRISQVQFEGKGCAISMASASMMSEAMTGRTVDEALTLFDAFRALVTDDQDAGDVPALGKLNALKGVREFPSRVKCATLAWHTLVAALCGDVKAVSTEAKDK